MHGNYVKSQLYGEAADIRSRFSSYDLKFENGAELIIIVDYPRHSAAVISEAYDGFRKFLNTKRGEKELVKIFETRFSAEVTKSNLLSDTLQLPQYITA